MLINIQKICEAQVWWESGVTETESVIRYTGWPKKSKPPPIFQKKSH